MHICARHDRGNRRERRQTRCPPVKCEKHGGFPRRAMVGINRIGVSSFNSWADEHGSTRTETSGRVSRRLTDAPSGQMAYTISEPTPASMRGLDAAAETRPPAEGQQKASSRSPLPSGPPVGSLAARRTQNGRCDAARPSTRHEATTAAAADHTLTASGDAASTSKRHFLTTPGGVLTRVPSSASSRPSAAY